MKFSNYLRTEARRLIDNPLPTKCGKRFVKCLPCETTPLENIAFIINRDNKRRARFMLAAAKLVDLML